MRIGKATFDVGVEHCKATQRMLDSITEDFGTWEAWIHAEHLLNFTESPIEEMFALGILRQLHNSHIVCEDFGISSVVPNDEWDGVVATLVRPQVRVLEYRVDFLVCRMRPSESWQYKVAVECDGHDYHHANKEQVDRDNKRSADLLSYGIATVRFSGSRLYKEPNICAMEVMDLLRGKETELLMSKEAEGGLLPA